MDINEVLPEDIVFNIFSRIPLKPLFRLRSVSKQWCKLIDHPYLAATKMGRVEEEDHIPIILHLKHPPLAARKNTTSCTLRLHMLQRRVTNMAMRRTTSYMLQATDVPFVEYFNLKRSLAAFGSCNGLVYFAEQCKIRGCSPSGAIIVSNPLRRVCLKLSSFYDFAVRKTYGLGFDCSNNSFKMVCVFSREWECRKLSKYAMGTVVQTLGTNTWREISQVPPCPISGTPVYTRGFLHWKIDPCIGDYENIEAMVISFDVTKEEFKFTPHPYFHSKDSSLFQLLEWNDNLAMVDLTSWEIWVRKDYDRKYWVKECCIPIAAPGLVEFVGLSKNGEVLIKSNGGFFIYGPKTDQLHYVQISCPYSDPSVHCFTGSLFSIGNSMAENDQEGNGIYKLEASI